ncbi:MAG: FG-GAP repeat protein [Pseudomonadota bacterium]
MMKTGTTRTVAMLMVLLTELITNSAWALTSTEIQKLLANDGADVDLFGASVDVDGNTAVIGARYSDGTEINSGAVYVYVQDVDGLWMPQAKLSAPDGVNFDEFGYSVAINGDTIVIGAYGDDDNGSTSGSAYVFTRNGSTWSVQAKLIADDAATSDYFGFSVAASGNTAVVGAPQEDQMGFNSGSAYIFSRDNSGIWTQQAKLIASDGNFDDRFGISVSTDGDTAVIGAYKDDDNGTDSGSAYVFVRGVSGVWTQISKLTASDGVASDRFGNAVAVDGDTAVIGALSDDDNGNASGSAYVFTRSNSSWSEQTKLTASDGASGDEFGYAVAITGDMAVIGARLDDDILIDSGSAYVFTRIGTSWSEQVKLNASDGASGDAFGYSIAISGETVVVGAANDDDNGTASGSAYVYSVFSTDDEAPVTANVLSNPNPAPINTPVTLFARVDDSTTGGTEVISVFYTVDGGTANVMTASDGGFDSSIEQAEATLAGFSSAGIYKLCVSGMDAAGNTSDQVCTLLAVYDPNAGFITGSGWIQSPVGACQFTLACTTLSGHANFGFMANYKKKEVPTGNTEFQFQTGSFVFNSDTYEWLVISGTHKAIFRGSGTINSTGNYGFLLSAIDAEKTQSLDVDTFRIQIWDKSNNDTVVYDNEITASETDNPTTTISGGDIVIHTKGKK